MDGLITVVPGDVLICDKIERSASDKTDASFFHSIKYNQHISVPFTVPGKMQLSTAHRSNDLTKQVIIIGFISPF
jgi:hypothetical protein